MFFKEKGKRKVNQEIIFAQTLERVRRLAKEQGNCIGEEQVREEFAALDLRMPRSRWCLTI